MAVSVSVINLLTAAEIRQHIESLKRWEGMTKDKADERRAIMVDNDPDVCNMCCLNILQFEPAKIYCTVCELIIKWETKYRTTGGVNPIHTICEACWSNLRRARGEYVLIQGLRYLKTSLEVKQNIGRDNEEMVQCDRCQRWQHHICALFNKKTNTPDTEYTCPVCCCLELDAGTRVPLDPSVILRAEDLPTTVLSDHLTERLERKLQEERTARALALGVATDAVPAVENLVVRAVLSIDRKVDVKENFLKISQEKNYPTSYKYKSKAVLLFQKIEGVEVCIFVMFADEFGSENPLPNQRRVYLSYLDSVKYFRPDIRAAGGESLRTFVYHEILIGYLDYCRKRGFSSCYIWACPPSEENADYILYCHPEIQQVPRVDQLQNWYLAMLGKARDEKIVVEVKNMHEEFFVSTGECRAEVTAGRLPYFDGDFFSDALESWITTLRGRKEKALKRQAQAAMRPSKRSKRDSIELAPILIEETELMTELGSGIFRQRHTFMMVHMHHACTHCRLFILTDHRWACNECANFQLCDACYDAEQRRDSKDRHPINMNEMHYIQMIGVPEADMPKRDTEDADEFMDSEIFSNRVTFLSLCQGNHYQFNTLRNAKHSSTMVLFHLHNPAAPAFMATCNVCQSNIEGGTGWHCETCQDFDLCDGCKDTANHPHDLQPIHAWSTQNREARRQRVVQVQRLQRLIEHATTCGLFPCTYWKCNSVKSLSEHARKCRARAAGGCFYCRMMWYLLQLHARVCTAPAGACPVPQCGRIIEQWRLAQEVVVRRRRTEAELASMDALLDMGQG